MSSCRRFLPLVALCLAALLSGATVRAEFPFVDSLPEPGDVFPTFTATTLDGKRFDWSEYRDRVVLVDFFSTTCGPCWAKQRYFKELYDQYHVLGFEVLTIVTNRDAPDRIENWRGRTNYPWPAIVLQDHVDTYEWLAWRLVGRDGLVVEWDTEITRALDRLVPRELGQLVPQLTSEEFDALVDEWATSQGALRDVLAEKLEVLMPMYSEETNIAVWDRVAPYPGMPTRPQGPIRRQFTRTDAAEFAELWRASVRRTEQEPLDTFARLLYVAGLYEEALQVEQELMPTRHEGTSEWIMNKFRLAAALARTGRTEEALTHCRDVTDLGPPSYAEYLWYGSCAEEALAGTWSLPPSPRTWGDLPSDIHLILAEVADEQEQLARIQRAIAELPTEWDRRFTASRLVYFELVDAKGARVADLRAEDLALRTWHGWDARRDQPPMESSGADDYPLWGLLALDGGRILAFLDHDQLVNGARSFELSVRGEVIGEFALPGGPNLELAMARLNVGVPAGPPR